MPGGCKIVEGLEMSSAARHCTNEVLKIWNALPVSLIFDGTGSYQGRIGASAECTESMEIFHLFSITPPSQLYRLLYCEGPLHFILNPQCNKQR